ncbi:molybdate ABC transporter substrate-binding protein, partial [Pseudomonas sp. MPR-R5A]
YDLLVEEGNIAEEDGIDLLGNELVLVVPEDDSTVENYADLVKDEVEKISIGTPETVPAGAYGQEALENMKIWHQIESKMVFAK